MTLFPLEPGDPTPVGYLTVLLYFLAALTCFRASRIDDESRSIWLGLCGLLIALGVNKQLDLQTAFTELGRRLARSESWYECRRRVQLCFIAGMIVVGAAVAVTLVHVTRSKGAPVRTAIVGAIALLIFVVIRAASFHHVDLFLKSDLFGVAWNACLELAGIVTIIAGAWSACRTFR